MNAIHPGDIWTPMVENHRRATAADLSVARVAAAAAHPIVTGAEIVIDGGYTAL